MSVYTRKLIQCDECGYEYPNDYYFGKMDWIGAIRMSDDKQVHFCSDKCAKNYGEILLDPFTIYNINNYLKHYIE